MDRLLVVLTTDELAAFARIPKENLSDLHSSLGLTIRKSFGLDKPNSKLLAFCSKNADPYATSELIMTTLWQRVYQAHA